MTPEAQRIAIAEACPHLFRVMKHSKELCWIPPGHKCEQDVDPVHDLNAMHEAEEAAINIEKWAAYADSLSVIALRDHESGKYKFGSSISATAPQRAEAFLRTVGKWEESK